jgi:hypothetical protein
MLHALIAIQIISKKIILLKWRMNKMARKTKVRLEMEISELENKIKDLEKLTCKLGIDNDYWFAKSHRYMLQYFVEKTTDGDLRKLHSKNLEKALEMEKNVERVIENNKINEMKQIINDYYYFTKYLPDAL